MAPNAKVALLMLGLLGGGVAGYLTRPGAADTRGAVLGRDVRAASESDAAQHMFIYAFAGGVAGLLVGFAVGR